jgi:high-affinity iron transporter
MLLATAVLFYVSYWLTSKAEAERWQRYVQTQVQAALGAGSLVTLWCAAFLAVYREGAETVLFYQALLAGSGPGEGGAVLAGLGVGSLVLVALFLLLRSGALRISIRPFFTVTSVLLYALAFVFAGRGIRELQESGLIGATPASWIPTWDFLGLYPTWESVGLQAVLVAAAAVAAIHLVRRRGQRVSAEAVRP